jgi:diguanylate cyclase (GGDEF)-like protein
MLKAKHGTASENLTSWPAGADEAVRRPQVPAGRVRRLEAVHVVQGAALIAFASGIVWRPAGQVWAGFYDAGLYNAVHAAGAVACWATSRSNPRQRTAWRAVSIALACQVVGNAIGTVLAVRSGSLPDVSLTDIVYVAFYPLLYIALVGLVRSRVPRFHASMWLDGVIGALGAAAVTVAVLLRSSLHVDGRFTTSEVVTLAYPVADVLLLVLLVGVAAVLGLRMNRTLLLFAAGLVCQLVGDILYLGQTQRNAYVEGGWLDLTWLLAAVAFTAAARQARRHPGTTTAAAASPLSGGWRVIAVPVGCNLVSVGVLGAGWRTTFPPLAAAFAIGCVLAGLVRLTLTFREVRALSGAREQAMTDELTGLPNRRALLASAAEALELAGPDRPVSFLLLDLDGFKDVNDALGHHAGDSLLRQIGPRLRPAVGPRAGLARLGGDEFAVLLPETGLDAALACARRIRDQLTEPFTVVDVRVHVDASIGVTVAVEHLASVIELLRQADIAMYAAKATNLGVHAYAPSTDGTTGDLLLVMDELRTALADDDQIVIHVQPQVDIASGVVCGAEALVRWQHPVRGLLSPADVLPAAAKAGLLLPLADRVLELALTAAGGWWATRQVPISVNLSAPNVTDLDLPRKVAAALARHGLPSRALTLELVEDTLMADPERGRAVLGRLRALGVSTSIDDYGTGYSSLAYLRDLPLDELKLDRAFTRDLAVRGRAMAIVKNTVNLAHDLDLRVVAEGVEDQGTLDLLRSLGCDAVQGYLMGRPVPVADFQAAMAAPRTPRPSYPVAAR